MKVVTISSWLNFGRPGPPGRGLRQGENFWLRLYYSQRAVFASLRALFSFFVRMSVFLNSNVFTRRRHHHRHRRHHHVIISSSSSYVISTVTDMPNIPQSHCRTNYKVTSSPVLVTTGVCSLYFMHVINMKMTWTLTKNNSTISHNGDPSEVRNMRLILILLLIIIITLVPWKGGKSLAWNVTAVCTVADSYVSATARDRGRRSSGACGWAQNLQIFWFGW